MPHSASRRYRLRPGKLLHILNIIVGIAFETNLLQFNTSTSYSGSLLAAAAMPTPLPLPSRVLADAATAQVKGRRCTKA